MTRFAAGLTCAAVHLALAAGCSKPAAKLGQVSGKVTFKGKPVPAGYVSFLPDSTGGNLGPVKVAQITDGVYDTSKGSDPGVSPGPTLVRIAGFDGRPLKGFAQGKQIFNPYQTRASLPDGTSVQDFTVPASAAENLKIEPTSDEP